MLYRLRQPRQWHRLGPVAGCEPDRGVHWPSVLWVGGDPLTDPRASPDVGSPTGALRDLGARLALAEPTVAGSGEGYTGVATCMGGWIMRGWLVAGVLGLGVLVASAGTARAVPSAHWIPLGMWNGSGNGGTPMFQT